MISDHPIWQKWIDALHNRGMNEVAATILEAMAPLNFLSAQAVHLGQPILNTFLSEDQIEAFTDLLDNPDQTRTFIESLRKRRQTG